MNNLMQNRYFQEPTFKKYKKNNKKSKRHNEKIKNNKFL